MGIRSALKQNYYMDYHEVTEAAEHIRSVMADMDACMWEADRLFCRIAELAEGVPAEARCGALLSACENARAGIRKADFLEYGNRVSQNMIELADYSEYVSGETVKGMEDVREKLASVRGTVAELHDLMKSRAYRGEPGGIPKSLKGMIKREDGAVQEAESGYGQDSEEGTEYELTTSYLAAVLSGAGADSNGHPQINSGTESLMYSDCYEKIESGEYGNYYMAARLAGLNISGTGAPVINSAEDSKILSYYLNGLQQRKASGFGLSMEGMEILRNLELADWQLEDVGVVDDNGKLIGIMPYYVMVSNGDGTHTSDGGVTIGVGHYISVREWENETGEDHQLLAPYVPDDFELKTITVNNEDLLPKGGYLVQGADMVPMDAVEQIFRSDIEEHRQEIIDYLIGKNITVTQSQFDALVICRFNSGSLSAEIQRYLEDGNWDRDDWYSVWPANRRDVCQNLFFGGEEDDNQ